MDKTTRYIAAVACVVVLLIIGLFLLFGRSSKKPEAPNISKTSNLAQYAPRDSFVTFTTQGRVVGEDSFHSIRITVTPTERRLEILDGYADTVQRTQSYDNTQLAYQQFLAALDRAGYGKSQITKNAKPDGVCPLGNRFLYQLDNNGDKIINAWSTTCAKADGNFGGNTGLVRTLFQQQITDYSKLVTGVRL